MRKDSFVVLPEDEAPFGLEADLAAHRRASQPRLAVPQDLAPSEFRVGSLEGAFEADSRVDQDRMRAGSARPLTFASSGGYKAC